MIRAMGPVRAIGACLSLCVAALAWPAPVEAAPGGHDAQGSPGGLPEGASEGWLSQVRRSIEAERYGAAREDGSETAFRAANPAHGFDSRFHGRGVMIRRDADAAAGRPAFEWGLALRGWGRREALQDVPEGRLLVAGSRVELARGALTEWFVNTPEGLEHGFTLPGPPEETDGPLVLDLALEGGLRPVFDEDGQAIDFFDAGNIGVLRYADLLVTDATGAKLPSRMEPIPGGIRIAVDDDRAVYPLLVDPLATSPAWTASGDEDFSLFGSSVTTAGDVNGDGYADVLVAAWNHDGGGGSGADRGRVYLYLGSASGPGVSPAWTGSGDENDSAYGYQVATAGDVNGDGYSDVIVGAIWHDAGAGLNSDRGRAYVYLGSASGLAGSPAWTGSGDETLAFFGRSVATAGDVNGDGYSDVIVGADSHNAGGLDRGRAYLYLGSAAGLAGSPAWTGSGDENEAFYGRSVAPAGDVNGDGFADVVVGAYQHDAGGGDRGRAYLHLGSSSGLAVSPAWTGSGDEIFARFGYSVATAGDVNGDGYSDVVVSAPFHDAGAGFDANRGRAYVYFGSASGLAVSPAWTGSGDENVALYGGSVATAGDVNGDGYSDVVVGAYGHDIGLGVGANRGRAYLYLGSASGLAVSPTWTVSGDETNASFGASVATAGDVNGDGYADVLVGAARHDAGGGAGADRGRAYLYLGSASGLGVNPAWTGSGDDDQASFGGSVATAGDVNGDGYSEVVVGARYHDAGAGADTLRGRAYLYLGSASGLAVSPAWMVSGDEDYAEFGSSVATAGDVNGDGYADVIVGADRHDAGAGGDADRGRAYLYLGSVSGLAVSPVWTGSGDEDGALFGASVATAGDVNGDGYADVAVGAFAHEAGLPLTDEVGRAYLYLGSAAGLAVSPAWTGSGDETDAHYGSSVATAGDINGDGYADLLVAASTHDGGAGSFANRGRAYLYLGSASGLVVSPAWTISGDQNNAAFGGSLSTAGDVNGDGCADVVVAAAGHDAGAGASAFRGRVYNYLGCGGAGFLLRPRQLRADLSGPIAPGGRAHQQQFRLGLNLSSPVGVVSRALQWQIRSWGGSFSPALAPIQSDDTWHGTPQAVAKLLSLSVDGQRYIWRARARYHTAQSPFVGWSRWVTLSGNGLYEADLRSSSQAAPPPCVAPDEEIYIVNVTLDLNGNPVLHYMDPNQPAEVTGYNIYRSPSSTGPWTLIGSNVVDMDAGTANKQYVDPTGGGGATWFYEVAAVNAVCGAVGPW